jgi:hypothetical protein
MNDFYSDVREKKRIASGARHMSSKRHGRKCMFDDTLTESAWKKRNGSVKCFNMRKPMTWEAFLSASVFTQTEYLRKLTGSFGVGVNELAVMFGASTGDVFEYIKGNQIPIWLSEDAAMTEENVSGWREFLGDTQGSARSPVRTGSFFSLSSTDNRTGETIEINRAMEARFA